MQAAQWRYNNVFLLQVFKVVKMLLAKIEKASEDPESAVNQTGEWRAPLVGKRKGWRACVRASERRYVRTYVRTTYVRACDRQ